MPRADIGKGKKPSALSLRRRRRRLLLAQQPRCEKPKSTWTRLAESESDPNTYRLPIPRTMRSDLRENETWRRNKTKQFRMPGIMQTFNNSGIHLDTDECLLRPEDQDLCRDLLSAKRPLPKKSSFSEGTLEMTLASLRHLDDCAIMEDVGEAVIPAAFGTSCWGEVTEHLHESWDSVLPSAGVKARPDYSVGINPRAFSDKQRAQLASCVADGTNASFKATKTMYFPFLTAEVDCGFKSLALAEHQNAYNGAVAMKAVVDLFRARGNIDEVQRRILAFSVSLNNLTLSIHAHYPVIQPDRTAYCRRHIVSVNFEANKGQYRWISYHVIMNIYDMWLPGHIDRLKKAIDGLEPKI